MQPLTHHEIMDLAEPFVRRARHVDLAASNRLERLLRFKPVEHAAQEPILREVLQLENPWAGFYRLTRVLTCGHLEAQLKTEGGDFRALLARVAEVPPHEQFHAVGAALIAVSYRLVADRAPIFLRGMTRIAELDLTLTAPALRGEPAELDLHAAPDDTLTLPEDLFAVLGRSWSRLTRTPQGWSCPVRLARSEPGRSRDAVQKLDRSVRHLAGTLAEPPGRFHERYARARFAAAAQRAIPLLVCIGLIAGAAALPRLVLAQDSVIRMLLFNSPPLLMMAFFCMRELPRIEIPPLPRRLRASAWRESQPPGPAAR